MIEQEALREFVHGLSVPLKQVLEFAKSSLALRWEKW